MNVLVTGSEGFIAKNIIEKLGRIDNLSIITLSKSDSLTSLEDKMNDIDFVFHLAGINRTDDTNEFYRGNRDLTDELVKAIVKSKKRIPILLSSSIQALENNDYGKSKLQSEEVLEKYSRETKSPVYIYRLPNVFGKWSRPNYNTVIATWCYKIARDLPLQISSEDKLLNLVYIDDVVHEFAKHLGNAPFTKLINYCDVSPLYTKTLGEIKQLLINFKNSRNTLLVSNVGSGFERALYATYLSFLPKERFSYELNGHADSRGSFFEFVKTLDSGQFSISTSAPGVTRGNHYHNTKNEKFLVVKGSATIKLRQIHGDTVLSFDVSGDKFEVVHMIPGYTHSITNTGQDEMTLLIWANEIYDKDAGDTYFLNV